MAEEGNCELAELPEPIIQVIQSFLTGKEAARTITLSKSWHNAWLTRPNLDFDESDFPKKYGDEDFSEIAKKTLQRYEDSNLKIETLRLVFQSPGDNVLANLLIVKALKLCGSHLRIEIDNFTEFGEFGVLAREVFESENLVGLSVKGRGIDIGVDHNVRCYKLETLCLDTLKIENRDAILNIISSCPLIRNLSLSIDRKRNEWGTWDVTNPINLPKFQNLKCLVLTGFELDALFFRDMSSNLPSLKELTLELFSLEEPPTKFVGLDLRIESLSFARVWADSRTVFKIISSCPLIENLSLSSVFRRNSEKTNPINLPKLDNLKCLTLTHVKLKSLILSYKLPALKHLTLDGVFQNDDFRQEEEEIRISSRSLERLDIFGPRRETSKFKLDVPSIQKFVIEAASWCIPKVSFESTSEEWESHVSINFDEIHPLQSASFLKLNELLTALSPSKCHLFVNGSCDKSFDYNLFDIQGLPQPRLENLTLDIQSLPSLSCYALFDGLFRICRPQLITQYHYEKWGRRTNINEFLSERFEQGINGVFSFPENFMYGLHGLKEVHVQVLDVGIVSDLPRKPKMQFLGFGMASRNTLKPKQKFLFQLVWKP